MTVDSVGFDASHWFHPELKYYESPSEQVHKSGLIINQDCAYFQVKASRAMLRNVMHKVYSSSFPAVML